MFSTEFDVTVVSATAEDASSGNPTRVSTIYGVGGTIRLLAGEIIIYHILCIFFFLLKWNLYCIWLQHEVFFLMLVYI